MKGGWADIPLLLILVLITFVLLAALALKHDTMETRVTQRQAEIMATKGAYELLLDSLTATWQQVGTDIVLNASSSRFGLPLYLYKFDPAAPESWALPATGKGCTENANPAICWPGAVAKFVQAVTLPSSFGITVNVGRIRSAIQQVTLEFEPGELALAADGVHGSVQHTVKITGGATSVDANPSIGIEVPTRLDALISAAQAAVSSASTIRAQRANWIAALSNAMNVRIVQLSALDARLQSMLAQARDLLPDITTSTDERTSYTWRFAEPALRLEYDAGVRLSEGLQGRTTILANCTQNTEWQVQQTFYNRFAGAIEAGMPDLLDRYANGRALLASIAAPRGWNPDDLFGNGKADAAESAIAKVQSLLEEFEAGSVTLSSLYSDWKANCAFGRASGLLRLPLAHSGELRIVGCFGDRRCSGGGPATELGETFYNGIDILAKENEAVYAMEGGQVVEVNTACGANADCPGYGELRGIGNYIILRHESTDGGWYYTFYGHLGSADVVSGNVFVLAGQQIGTAGKSGNTTMPLLHVQVFKTEQNVRRYSNPCAYLGCMPATPLAAGAALPKPIVLASAQDYAAWLTQKDGAVVSLGDDFCAPSDRKYRGSNLEYGLYSSENPDFNVWAAFDGTVTAIKDDESGCGRAVFVDSGDFITVYERINPVVAVGDKVWMGSGIGRVANIAKLCPDPRLSVVFSERSFVLHSDDDRCGRTMDCSQGFTPAQDYRCDVGKSCYRIGGGVIDLGIPEQYCAALEWPVRRTAAGVLWGRTPDGFERKPVELGFRISDSFGVLDCSEHDDERLTWLNPKDLLCDGSVLWTCGASITGAERASNDECVGDTSADCAGGWKCVVVGNVHAPAGVSSAVEIVLRDRTISKFCAQNEEKRDWICCQARGGNLNCPPNKWSFDGKELTCTVDADCAVYGA